MCRFMVMKWPFLMILLIIVVGSMILQVSNGCVEDERMNLLHIKTFFLSHDSSIFQYRSNPFPSWVGPNCCNWDRVICNSTSGGHVVELWLNNLLDPYDNLLNASLFQNFKHLKTLDLSHNWFSNFTSNQAIDAKDFKTCFLEEILDSKLLERFNHISSFNKLESLNLSDNNFGNKIFSSLSGITSLKKLTLRRNGLKGSIIIPGPDEFSRLEILNLGGNWLNNSVFSSLRGFISLKTLELQSNYNLGGTLPMQDIAKLKSLEFLDLSYNDYYNGVIPLQDLKNLKVLILTNNRFNGSLPMQGFCETNNLVKLEIAKNQISDQLSDCVGNFTRLKVLDISNNQFNGKIPTTISNLKSIENLNLLGNYFEGSFSLSLLANHSKLKYLRLTGNGKVGVETEESPWHPSFQLEYLILRDCNLNTQTSSMIPTFLLSQHELIFIDIAHNQLVGNFPLWLLDNNSKLELLDLSDNSFNGTLPLSNCKHNLSFLQISGNKLSGQLPKDTGLFLPKLLYFNVSRNRFEGNLPPSMQQMKKLVRLDVSNNKFYGNLQTSMFNDMYWLQVFLVTNNNFSGSIEEYGFINNTDQLVVLDISNNMISGRIPSWIGSLKGIKYIQMSNNLFTGELPKEMCSLGELQLLDLSQNQLIGGVPSCFNASSLVYLYMQQNYLSGPIPPALLSTTLSLKILDLSFNDFSGHIPDWFGQFTSLRVLLLKENKLEGPIPLQLCQVGEISIMDLSNNRLTGSIPSCLSNITFGGIEVTLASEYQLQVFSFVYLSFLSDIYFSLINYQAYSSLVGKQLDVTVDFTAKHRAESYKSYILDHMSGLDLSSNQLTGKIPQQIGDLLQIHALNFSHNKLVGPIPKGFSNLKHLESLDLSNNLLSGNIPVELGGLDSLSTFNVAYNNLSGMIPSLPKFSSYPESSYYGNPYLCGLYIQHKCSGSILPPSPVNLEEEHGAFIDLETFFWSFGASYIVILLGFVAVLYINPQWRQTWFYFVEDCYYYVCKCIS